MRAAHCAVTMGQSVNCAMSDVQYTQTALARKLGTFMLLSAAEQQKLTELQIPMQSVKRGKQLIREGEAGHEAFVLQAGWACSYKDSLATADRSFHSQSPATLSAYAASS